MGDKSILEIDHDPTVEMGGERRGMSLEWQGTDN